MNTIFDNCRKFKIKTRIIWLAIWNRLSQKVAVSILVLKALTIERCSACCCSKKKASGSCIYKPDEHQNIVCFAGGVGITPMISMIRTARRLGKKATLYYAVKNQESNPYPEEIQTEELFIGDNKLSFSHLCSNHEPDTHFFLCGPRNFIDDGVQLLQQNGYKNVHFERWW